MTGSTYADQGSAHSSRPTPEGPARDNPIAGPRMGMTRSEPSALASAGASGRHNEPGSRPAFACPAQPPIKSGGGTPRGGKGHHGVGKADRSTKSNWTGEGATHHAGQKARQRGSPPATTKAHRHVPSNSGLGAANPDRAHNTQRTTARQQVPGNTRWTDGQLAASPAPTGYGTAAVADGQMRARQRGQPLPAMKQPSSGCTSACPAGTQPLRLGIAAVQMDNCVPRSDAPHTQHNTPSAHTLEQEPRGPGHRTHNTQHNTPSEHSGEQEPSGPGHRAHNTTGRSNRTENRSQGAQGTAHATQHTERAHQVNRGQMAQDTAQQQNTPSGHW